MKNLLVISLLLWLTAEARGQALRCPKVEHYKQDCPRRIEHHCFFDNHCSAGKRCCPSTNPGDGGCTYRCEKAQILEGCPKPVDLALLIDSSGSISRRNFIVFKSFLKRLVDQFDISEDGTHVALVVYSTEASVWLNFNKFTGSALNAVNIKRSIETLPHFRELTYIDKALKRTNKEVFSIVNGMRKDVSKLTVTGLNGKTGASVLSHAEAVNRPEHELVPIPRRHLEESHALGKAKTRGRATKPLVQIAMVITDGVQTVKDKKSSTTSQEILRMAVKPIKDRGIEIITIGIGKSIVLQDLVEMATSEDGVFEADDFNALDGVVSDITGGKCPVDGEWSEWSKWTDCTETCGGGMRNRSRTCTNPRPQHGGLKCPGSSEEEEACNVDPCPVHGDWSEWGDWGTCTVTCGGGEEIRKRTCTNPPPTFGGRPCTGDAEESRACGQEPCPVDGNWSEWKDWGECPVTCGGGEQTRARTCTNPPPAFGGEPCAGESEDTRPCNEAACPIDGNWSDWKVWSDCPVTCGGGLQNRSRTCTNPPPAFGGESCPGKSDETRPCNEDPCPIDGNWSEWEDWSECPVTCGGGEQTRARTCTNPAPEFGGKPCLGENEESRRCNEEPCPIDGNWSDWKDWSDCPVTCGGGVQNRSRTCTEPPPAFGGESCPGESDETRSCNESPCPVFGNWAEWKAWGLCSVTCGGGEQARSRSCTNPPPAFGGDPCPGESEETQPCNQEPCPIDGNWSDWKDWSDCPVTCGGGVQNRSRTCTEPPPAFGGESCSGESDETRPCNEKPCPGNGNWADWKAWGNCPVTCGGGVQSRTRTCTDPPPTFGGEDCVGESDETRACNEDPCPIDGNWSDWKDWSDCPVTCGGGVQNRSRTCTNPPPAFGGESCPGESDEKRPCNEDPCPVDGNWSDWKDWSDCPVTCGGGVQNRSRTCTNPPPAFGGESCPGESDENRPCNEDPCPIDGNWSDWKDWSDCPVTCGGGVQNRSRTCTNPPPAFGGESCPGESDEKRPCNEDPCPIDGNWSDWKDWSDCPVTCGGGLQNRSRTCTEPPPAFGGESCPGKSDETRTCNEDPCPIDGGWSEWGPWGDCTVTCGGGSQVHSRSCNNPPPAFGGLVCIGESEESRECNTESCGRPPDIVHIATSAALAQIGQEVELKCVTDGDPTPNVTWYRPDGSLLVTNTAFDNTVSVNVTSDDDFGEYRCKADNGLGLPVEKIVLVEPQPTAPPQLIGPPGDPGPKGMKGDKGVSGPTGPEGERGVKGAPGNSGPKGRLGPRGLPGPPGQMVLNFNTSGPDAGPLAGLITVGGSKGPNVGYVEIKGAPGEPGPAGSAGIPGFRGPDGELGEIGESGRPGSTGETGDRGLQGPPGIRGRNGEDGFPGPAGEPGEVGPMGEQGPTGVPGARGLPGNKGDRGGQGSEGDPGDPGRQGPTGGAGQPGRKGLDGNPGQQGAPGPSGQTGETGRTGRQGINGKPGTEGPAGVPGETGEPGTAGPPGPKGDLGPQGTMGSRGDNGELGPTGPPGEQGDSGRPGQAGEPGLPGLKGMTGRVGNLGVQGDQGRKGDEGVNGQPGAEGRRGERGPPGLPGPRGRNGVKGNQGDGGQIGGSGPNGPRGKRGSRGRRGSRGLPGEMGPKGPQGESGFPGAPGREGQRGHDGLPGVEGIPGAKGDQGSAGEIGESGRPGVQGLRGAPGRTGKPGVAGSPGFPGDDGTPGRAGDPGTHGPLGSPGLQGAAGMKGLEGREGTQGVVGSRGQKGDHGQKGPVGKPGRTGRRGYHGNRGVMGFQGPKGAVGPSGAQGPPGFAGRHGRRGRTGERGKDGKAGQMGGRGPIGQIGLPGPPGPHGRLGQSGANGEDGQQGLPGARGPHGLSGRPGSMGYPGRSGPPGVRGTKGGKGSYGFRGLPGSDGKHGMPGDDGRTGSSGLPGLRGPKGKDGFDGLPGRSGKQGEEGPQGLRGKLGTLGLLGPPGPIGPSGSNGFKGATGPKGSKGKSGDLGVKGASGELGSMGFAGENGETGRPGHPGQRGRSGLPGRTGAPGRPGPEGKPGIPGRPGIRASKGSQGPYGRAGKPGPPGLPGTGGLNGERGRQGKDGRIGPPGPTGSVGPKGETGKWGMPGFIGARGVQGSNGELGDRGDDGKAGTPGEPGYIGYPGEDGKEGLPGPNGRAGFPGEDGEPAGNGEPGEKGDNGTTGSPGRTGRLGVTGPDGEPGTKGETGIAGAPGGDGEEGATGPRGQSGSQGLKGMAGEEGETGITGPQGDTGYTGTPGDLGESGSEGMKGEPGLDGNIGPQGPKGVVGHQGLPGPQGYNGMEGNTGLQGDHGVPGERGRTGIDGLPGPPGPPGPGGDQGIPGRVQIPHPNWIYGSQNKGPGFRLYSTKQEEPNETLNYLRGLGNVIYFYKSQSGTKRSPARSCRELQLEYPDYPSGKYWIDPNEGCSSDAVYVYCDLEKGATCVFPNTKEIKVPNAQPFQWMSESVIHTAQLINYSMNPMQMRFLRLLSRSVSQNITYHCFNSRAWEDDGGRTIKLQGDNEMELTSSERTRPVVVKNECKDQDNKWHKTILEFNTTIMEALPVIDAAPYDIASSNMKQEFFVELGLVCFFY